MEFLGNVFTTFIFENLFSHEALMMGRVTASGGFRFGVPEARPKRMTL